VVGDWPGLKEPVRGVAAYSQRLADLLALLPDMRLEVAEHAENGEYTFIRWVLDATGANGPFSLSGMDRVHVRDGKIVENVIRFDTAQFEARAGHPLPWS
jgi:ketosteroid isomerase-like protein